MSTTATDDTYALQHNDDVDSVRKRYESMSLDEMSNQLAENNRQLSEMLGNRVSMGGAAAAPLSLSPSSSNSSFNEEQSPIDNDDATATFDLNDNLDDESKRRKMNKLFSRAVSSGQIERVTQLLNDPEYRTYIDINAKDEDGTTPLIYAACFGKVEIAEALLQAGAKTDIQDASGWSALMWATTNHHGNLVRVLMDYGASAQTRTAKGRTVFDYAGSDEKMVEILATNPRNSMSSSVISSDCEDYYYDDTFMQREDERRRNLLETAVALIGGSSSSHETDADTDNENENNDDDDDETAVEFQWDRCLPDQMFVFGGDSLEHILDTVITHIKLPLELQQDINVPANVIFLSARFAHYFSSQELLNQVMDGALNRLSTVIKENESDVHALAFWLSNQSQLLAYLKRDSGLVVSTAEYQLRLSEMISETYTSLVSDTQRRLTKVLGPAMLEHEQVPGMEDVDFVDDWQRFFRRSSNRRSALMQQSSVSMRRHASLPPRYKSTGVLLPQSVTSILSTTFYVLQKYQVHPTIIIQALAQFLHCISCEVFNRILTNKKHLSRSKALQIRMNLSYVEDWVRHNRLPTSLLSYLSPSTQLLQLLQCLSQLQDFESFIMTFQHFDQLNALQVKRCVVNYRYEVNEQRLPDEIEQYIVQLAHDTIRYREKQRQQQKQQKSIEDEIHETLDARFMLPFSLPTTAKPVGVHSRWCDAANKDRKDPVPMIPDAWMEKLDYDDDDRL